MKNFILFDFDGVIVDTLSIAYETMRLSIPTLTLEEYRKAFEGNINEWVKVQSNNPQIFVPGIDFHEEYSRRYKTDVKFFPGISEVIKKISEEYSLVIISSSVTSVISGFVELNGLKDCFMEILGNDVNHSKVEKIKMIFEKYSVGAENCVFVTDTLGDMIEAEKTGVGAIGVSWGFNTAETLKKGNPFMTVDKPEELYPTIQDYFNK